MARVGMGLERLLPDLGRANRLASDRSVQLQLFDTLPPPRSPLRLGRLLSELDRLVPELGRRLRPRRTALSASSRAAVDAVSLLAIRRIRLSVERRRRRTPRRWTWPGLYGR